MNQGAAQPSPDCNLKCFDGNQPPAEILAGWKALLAMPRKVVDSFWPLVEAALRDPDNPQNKTLIEIFCQQHGLNPVPLVAAIRACDFLLRQASAMNLSDADFRGDLERLSAGDPVGTDLLMSRFGEVRQQLRLAILEDTLADHGNVLVGLEWRVDQVQVSHRGAGLDTPVMFLSLRYRAEDEVKRLSLQLTPDAFHQLKSFCDEFAE